MKVNLYNWEQTNIFWGRRFGGPVLIIYYEDVVTDIEKTLRDILEFIDFSINEGLMRCALLKKGDIYRREKRLLGFDPYTPEMKSMIEEKRNRVYSDLGHVGKRLEDLK